MNVDRTVDKRMDVDCTVAEMNANTVVWTDEDRMNEEAENDLMTADAITDPTKGDPLLEEAAAEIILTDETTTTTITTMLTTMMTNLKCHQKKKYKNKRAVTKHYFLQALSIAHLAAIIHAAQDLMNVIVLTKDAA